MAEWIAEQLMKFAFGTAVAGIAWVLLVGVLAWTVPFWVIWLVCELLVFGIIFGLEHSDGHWDFF
ncbi:hypothetical protein SEA_BILLNYE_129 [Streptomyces phage BillNye]|uniref:Uncharacterized protein n=2 Tax=Wilnyevirus billnye TaxID=2560486 RepID=A0A2L1IVW8_9CAUD|nr:hypothetical protein FDJ30_gp127 [Streptomyces phage BillNye]AVD99306.1 hypothetical protein SEA_BILLNYE_129 [Streptomyces phage BillNye]QBZ72389.1 hypothetical protein SEA_CIRCINUS_130 [Streptomyces phage Circinus]